VTGPRRSTGRHAQGVAVPKYIARRTSGRGEPREGKLFPFDMGRDKELHADDGGRHVLGARGAAVMEMPARPKQLSRRLAADGVRGKGAY